MTDAKPQAKTRKVTAAQRVKIIKAFVQGATQREAAKSAGVCQQTAGVIEGSAQSVIKKAQQALEKQAIKEVVGDIAREVKQMDRIIDTCLKGLTPDKILSQSGAALSTTLAILIDKRQLLTGGITDNVHITVGQSRQEVLDYIKSGKRAEISPSVTMPTPYPEQDIGQASRVERGAQSNASIEPEKQATAAEGTSGKDSCKALDAHAPAQGDKGTRVHWGSK